MKLIYALALLSLPVSALAGTPDENLCGKPLPCGSFAGPLLPADGQKDDRPARETITLAPGEKANELVMSGTLDYVDGERQWEYRFLLTFAADKSFTFRDTRFNDEYVMGSGICSETLCGYTMRPNAELSTAGTFGVKNGAIIRSHANQSADGSTSLAVSTMVRL